VKWVEGAWSEEGDPVIPAEMPENVWIYCEVAHVPGQTQFPVGKGSVPMLVRIHRDLYQERRGRNPRWFWKKIPTAKPPSLTVPHG